MSFKAGYHYDQELEYAVVGAMMLEPDCIPRVHGLVRPEHFHYNICRIAFGVIIDMWSNGMRVDTISVVHEIFSRGLDKDLDNVPYQITLTTQAVASSAHIEQHALFVRQMAARRKRIEIQAMADANVDDDVNKLQDLVEQINGILTVDSGDDWHDMSQVMLSVSKHMDEVRGKDMLGIHSGFKELDLWTLGWQPGQLIVIAARPSVGKSAFVSSLAIRAAQDNNTVGIINLEMPEEQVGARLAAVYSDTEFWRIYTAKMNKDAEARLSEKMADMAGLPIYVSDKSNVTMGAIRAKATKLKNRCGLKMLIIDYLQLIEVDNKSKDTREREVAKLSRGMKLLAKELDIPVVLLCQLNRESEKAADKKPRMSNIRESGAIEQDADVVMLLHREWKAGKTHNEDGSSTEREGTIIVDKNRNGKIGEIQVGFEPETMKWVDNEIDDFKGLIPMSSVNYRDFTEPASDRQDDVPF